MFTVSFPLFPKSSSGKDQGSHLFLGAASVPRLSPQAPEVNQRGKQGNDPVDESKMHVKIRLHVLIQLASHFKDNVFLDDKAVVLSVSGS